MKTKADLTGIGSKVFYQYIYPVYAKEFLLGSDYDQFAKKVQETFILNAEQWNCILTEWDIKEMILK